MAVGRTVKLEVSFERSGDEARSAALLKNEGYRC